MGIDRCMPLSITLRASAMAVAGRLSSVFPCDFRGQIDYYGEEEAKKLEREFRCSFVHMPLCR